MLTDSGFPLSSQCIYYRMYQWDSNHLLLVLIGVHQDASSICFHVDEPKLVYSLDI